MVQASAVDQLWRRRPRPARERLVVGLMAGTSLDGIDAALVAIHGSASSPFVRLLAFQTFPYRPAVRARIWKATSGEPVTAGEISDLNFQLGELFGRSALSVCRKARISPSRLAYIGSHGQTIFHHGGADGRRPSTLQIGEPAVIAELTGAPVVADFRPSDMAAGGQGAPLVPIVDYLLLRDRRLGTVALNLGGIANMTAIPASARPEEISGFDTGPGNMVIDALVCELTGGRRRYDRDGRMAARGRVLEPLLSEMLRLPFFRRPPPKSCGREQFGKDFIERYFWPQRRFPPADLVRTATELTARSIAEALRRFVQPRGQFHRLVVSGGGAHNRILVERIRELAPCLSLHRSEEWGLPVDAKEAIAFALLADRTWHGRAGNLPSVTGARGSRVLGKVVWPPAVPASKRSRPAG